MGIFRGVVISFCYMEETRVVKRREYLVMSCRSCT